MLEVGQVWQNPEMDEVITITGFEHSICKYHVVYKGYDTNSSYPTNLLLEIFQLGNWELQSKSFKREYLTETPIKQCRHTNIREDKFFSAQVYKTCKDCGQALN